MSLGQACWVWLMGIVTGIGLTLVALHWHFEKPLAIATFDDMSEGRPAEKVKDGPTIKSLGCFSELEIINDEHEECEAQIGSCGDVENILVIASKQKNCAGNDMECLYMATFDVSEAEKAKLLRLDGKFNSGRECLQKAAEHPGIPEKFKWAIRRQLQSPQPPVEDSPSEGEGFTVRPLD